MSGELPPGWVEARFSEVATIASDLVDPREMPDSIHLAPDNIESWTSRISNLQTIGEAGVTSPKHRFSSDQIVYSKIRPYLAKAVIPGFDGLCSADMYPINVHINPKFLLRYMLTKDFVSQTTSHEGRTVLPKINQEGLNQTIIPLPPLPEQHRIVERIEALLSKGARAKAALDALPPLLDRYRQSLLAAAFRGDLTADWRMANPASAMPISMVEALRREAWERGMAARGLNPSRRRYYPAESGQAVPPLSLPDDWQWVSADVLCWEITVGHVGPMKERYVPSGIPFLRSQNVKQNRVVYDDVKFIDKVFHGELQKSVLHPGDIVVVRTGYPGTAAVIPELHAVSNCADLVISRPTAAIDPEYLSQYINSPLARIQIEQEQVGVAQQHFNVGSMSCLMVPFPTLEEQRQIAIRLKMEFQRLDSIMKTALSAASQHTTLTQSILAKAFRGELVPQDPADGPASVLLDRIRAGRAMVNGAKKRSVRRS